VSGPQYRVTATFDALSDEQTRITFRMVFETPAVCAQVKTFAVKANEENFDRLQKELKRMA
jgi:hypothetical protein